MKIWIDISNTPHVLFFRDFIRKNKNKHTFLITCRNHAETISLLNKNKINHVIVGKHEGKRKLNKIFGLLKRNLMLIPGVIKFKPDISFSCGSPYAAEVSFLLRIPHIAVMDNETAKFSNYLTVPFCKKLIIPKQIPIALFSRYFIKPNKIITYGGFKEMAYLEGFKPGISVLKELGLKKTDKICLIRTEVLSAAYYQGNQKNPITYDIIDYLSKNTDYKIVLLARTEEEKVMFKSYRNIIIPDNVIDAPSLIPFCKFVVSGGGTMNREACLLGVPAITTYPLDSMLSVDKYFVKAECMKPIKTIEDFKRINMAKIKKLRANDLKNPIDIINKIIEKTK